MQNESKIKRRARLWEEPEFNGFESSSLSNWQMMLNSRNISEKDKFHGIAKMAWSADVSECYYHILGQPSERSMVVPQRSSHTKEFLSEA